MPSSPDAVDALVSRLRAAAEVAGLPPLRPAARDARAVLGRIDADIAPLRLPAQLRRFWSLVDITSIPVETWPQLTTPEIALDTWHIDNDETGAGRRALLSFCYESWVHLGIELDTGTNDGGGACFSWAYDDAGYELVHADFAAYLDLLVTFVETGDFVRSDRGRPATIDEDQWKAARSVRLAAAMPHPVHGTRTTIGMEIEDLPPHWRHADGIADTDLVARGASTTIAELLAGAAAGRGARGTIHATVTRLAGSGRELRMTLSDGTGDLDAHCDTSVARYPVSMRQHAEFDVVLRPGAAPVVSVDDEQREVGRAAGNGDMRAASEAAGRMFGRLFGNAAGPARAEVTAARPIPGRT